ncbi:hypothetical protein GCM10009639_53830 [Kitasatospora putterlickiae]|uniref:Transposase n=1 Tax=Kitasatospora putterlickiae TaxID=221725 RepID=A0ABN1YDP5_9ACTN
MSPGPLHTRIEKALGIWFGSTLHSLDATHIASLGQVMDGEHRIGLSVAIGRRLYYVCRSTPRG